MSKELPASGDRFGMAVIIDCEQRSKSGHIVARFKCDCGIESSTQLSSLRSGKTKSCGCYRRQAKMTHGMVGTAEHGVWLQMNERCNNPKHKNFHNYGGRGIDVCDRWRGPTGFQAFLDDMGHRPSKRHSIDRIDNDGGYGPKNCEWKTQREQCRNKRNNHMITINGETKALVAWADHYGINGALVCSRIHRGWSEYDALTFPNMKGKKYVRS